MKPSINGEMLLGNREVLGSGVQEFAMNPATGEKLKPPFASSSSADIALACELAESAFDAYRAISLEQRAVFLETIGEEILALGDELIDRAVSESGLPLARIQGERGRTVGQLQLFAKLVRSGHWLDARIDPALPERTPLPRADLRSRHIPVGPIAVFGASNFPLAFSVAGGDTASALAAGCPVVVKAHPAHPGTSELVAKAIVLAAKKCNLPEGVFSMIFTGNHDLAAELVSNPAIKSLAFTGSRKGGLALMAVAASRPEPIPVFAEMSSINPVFLLPHSLEKNIDSLATNFIASLTMGAGQFCTNPGLVLGVRGNALSEFINKANNLLSDSPAQTMLSADIHSAYKQASDQLAGSSQVETLAEGPTASSPNACQAKLFKTTGKDFLNEGSLSNEIFGAAGLIIECESSDEFILIAEQLEGQLTVTLQIDDEDAQLAKRLIPVLERKAGRILCNGYPTGVEVCHAMVHGGPFPATSDSRTTSVGSAAIKRFLRPVCYQDFPDSLLPAELQSENSLGLKRLYDGLYQD